MLKKFINKITGGSADSVTFQQLQNALTTDDIMRRAGIEGGQDQAGKAKLTMADATILLTEKMVRAGRSELYEEKRLKAAAEELKKAYQKQGMSEEEAVAQVMEDQATLIKATTSHYAPVIAKSTKTPPRQLR